MILADAVGDDVGELRHQSPQGREPVVLGLAQEAPAFAQGRVEGRDENRAEVAPEALEEEA